MTQRKCALITGVTGQDGSYLVELLLEKGYEVHGLTGRSSNVNSARIDHLYSDRNAPTARLTLHYGDLSDGSSLANLLCRVDPTEVYNLGIQSHMRMSFEVPGSTGNIAGLGTIRLLEAIRDVGIAPLFYQASSSEFYRKVVETPQREATLFHPRSPYSAAKAYAFCVTQDYREAYGLFAVNGTLFNHEGPRCGETFVTRKITSAIARIKDGVQARLFHGSRDAKRDWGFSGDYVHAMWLTLQAHEPEGLVIATGETHAVREFLEFAGARPEVDLTGRFAIDPRYFRPAEVGLLLGDASHERAKLGWRPRVSFPELCT